MTQIYAFPLPDIGPCTLALPRHATVMSVGLDGAQPTLWCAARVDAELRVKHRCFFCALTDSFSEELDRALRFIGTIPGGPERRAVHVFEVEPPIPSS